MSESEWTTDVRPGYRTKTIRVGNCIVTVHRPILSDSERKKAEDRVKTALLNYYAEENKETKEIAS